MNLAVCGQLKFCATILKLRLEQKGYTVTHFLTEDAQLLARGRDAARPLALISINEARALFAQHAIDAVVIDMHLFASLVQLYDAVRRCKLAGLPVGLIFDPSNCGVFWLDRRKGFLSYMETNLIDGCNLNCSLCSHYAPLFDRDSAYDLATFRRDIQRIADCFDVHRFRLLGGEPLLLPNLADYVDAARAAFPQTNLHVVTNGLLVPSLPERLLECFRRHDVQLDITRYPPTDKLADRIVALLAQHKVRYALSDEVRDSFVAQNTPRPSHDPEAARKRCLDDNCRFLRDGKLYKCPVDALSYKFNEHFGTATFPTPTAVDIYAPNVTELTTLLDGSVDMCRFCTDQPRMVPWKVVGTPTVEDWLIEM